MEMNNGIFYNPFINLLNISLIDRCNYKLSIKANYGILGYYFAYSKNSQNKPEMRDSLCYLLTCTHNNNINKKDDEIYSPFAQFNRP